MRLGVNIDHIATIRNARGVSYPDPMRAAHSVAEAGADILTVHLREDRRHIRDDDVAGLIADQDLPVNLEMAPVDEMIDIACSLRPYACCLVPERRAELTTEGGLDVVGLGDVLADPVRILGEKGIRVSLFIDPQIEQLRAAQMLGVPCVELHTGSYAAMGPGHNDGLARLQMAAATAVDLGLECHAGHGLTYDTVGPVAALPTISELNIGHFLISESIFLGLREAVCRMVTLINAAGSSCQSDPGSS